MKRVVSRVVRPQRDHAGVRRCCPTGERVCMGIAQWITLSRVYNLAGARRRPALWQGASPAQTPASAWPSRPHGHPLRPATHGETVSAANRTRHPLPSRQRLAQRLGVLQVGRVKALGEPAGDRRCHRIAWENPKPWILLMLLCSRYDDYPSWINGTSRREQPSPSERSVSHAIRGHVGEAHEQNAQPVHALSL